jgi:hypothetical protein
MRGSGFGFSGAASIAKETTVSASSASVCVDLLRHGLTQVKAVNKFNPNFLQV